MSLERNLVFEQLDKGRSQEEVLDVVEGMRDLGVEMDSEIVEVAVKQYEVKQIIDAHNHNLKKQKIRDDAAEMLRKEQSTASGRKRLKNKKRALASERKRQERVSQDS